MEINSEKKLPINNENGLSNKTEFGGQELKVVNKFNYLSYQQGEL